MLTLNTIVCPVDFSEESKVATHFAAELARNSGARIVLVIAIPTSNYLLNYDAYTVPITDVIEAKEDADKELDLIIRELTTEIESLTITKLILEGNPADVILNAAAHESAEIIVMGSHGRRGLKRLLMGSVAEIVLRESTCPVLIVKSPKESNIV